MSAVRIKSKCNLGVLWSLEKAQQKNGYPPNQEKDYERR